MIKNIQNYQVPALGFGTYLLKGRDCTEGVLDAMEIGYRHVDTAQMYHNEAEVGQALEQSVIPRDEIFLTTKIWHENLEPERLRRTFEQSLNQLKTSYVDLLLIHWPSPSGYPLSKTLETMFELKSNGNVRNVGVSNFTPSLVKEAMEVGPVFTNQVEYHPFLDQTTLLGIARSGESSITAYRPVAGGTVVEDETLQLIGEQYGKSGAQVALRWLLQQDEVLAIPKSGSHQRRVENFQVFDFELTDEDMRRITKLDRGERMINPDFAPAWGT